MTSRYSWIRGLTPIFLLGAVAGCSWEDLTAKFCPEATEATPQEAAQEERKRASEDWWKEARTLDPEAKSDNIVSCDLEGSRRFMTREDCIDSGGEPG